MGVIIELILVFLTFCWVASEGVPWTLLFVPAYLGLLTLKITPVGRKIKRSRVFMAFLTLFVFVAFGTGAFAFRVLSDPVESIASSQIFKFLVDPLLLRLFWSGVIGVAVGIEVLAVLLLPIGFLVARGKYGDFEEYKNHKGQATRTAIYGFLGVSKGTWEVRGGKLEVLDQPDGSLARFGGPGELIVQQGHAVLLERDGNVTKVVGSGLTFLRAFEKVSIVVPLTAFAERVAVSHAVTKDKIILDAFECWVFHKVDPGSEETRILDGQFSYDEQILREKVWSANGKDWREAVRSISARCIRHVLGNTNLEDVIAMSDEAREAFNRRLQDRINKVTMRSLGVNILGVDADAIQIPAAVANQLLAIRMGAWAIQIAENRNAEMSVKGQGEATYLTTLEQARARAQGRMIQAIVDGFGNSSPPTATDVRDLRYIEALEKIADETTARVLFPYGPSLTDIEQIGRQASTPIVEINKKNGKQEPTPERRTNGVAETKPMTGVEGGSYNTDTPIEV